MSTLRRSAQTALYLIARDLLRLMAPVFCFTAEEAWGFLPKLEGDPTSVHLALLPGLKEPAVVSSIWQAITAEREALGKRYELGREVRRQVNVSLEEARQAKKMGSSVEAAVTVSGPESVLAPLTALGERELADLFIVSRVRLKPGGAALAVVVDNASGTKCGRCWLYRDEVGQHPQHPTLCTRCVEAL
jgi:isoleucyl-tRNA synthetase